jgi:sulfur-oxidizing protein SoxY
MNDEAASALIPTVSRPTSRRQFLISASGAAAGLGFVSAVRIVPADATPAQMQEAIRKVVGSAAVKPGRVKLDLPPLSENGNAVPLTVSVESAMSQADHVKAIHVFNEKNPQPDVVSFHLGPRAGRATVSTRIRLADTQTVVAIAELSDGSFWSARAAVVVTLAACLEDA